MWYVVQVNTGMEEKVCSWCRARIAPSVLEECFVPRREEKRKVCGEWKTLVKTLFPGYIILVSDQEEELYGHLREIPRFTRILGTGREVVPLTEREIKFLQQFCGKNHVAEMSEGIIEGDCVRVLTGPLEGLEACIKKIDRHKRKAYLELEMFGRMQTLEMGLEVAVKRVSEDSDEETDSSVQGPDETSQEADDAGQDDSN